MTCIVAISDGVNIWMGGDRAASDVEGTGLEVVKSPKVFARQSKDGNIWLFGFEGSFRLGQLIKHELELPRLTKEQEGDIEKFLVVSFIQALRQCLRGGGLLREETSGVEHGGCFIVGLKGMLFIIQEDFHVAQYDHTYAAIGCGEDFAKGSLFSTQSDPDVEKRILIALEAAQEHSNGVRDPFDFVNSQSIEHAPKTTRSTRRRPHTKGRK